MDTRATRAHGADRAGFDIAAEYYLSFLLDRATTFFVDLLVQGGMEIEEVAHTPPTPWRGSRFRR